MKRMITILIMTALLVSLAVFSSFAADGDSKSDPVEVIGTDTVESTDTAEPDVTTEPADTTDTAEPVDTTGPEDTKKPEDTKEPEDTSESGKSIFEIWRGEPGRDFVVKRTVDDEGNAVSGWALVNLLCTVGTVVFGGVATGEAVKVKKNKEEYEYGNENYVVLRKEKSETVGGVKTPVTEFKRKGKLWKSGFGDLLSGAAAVVAFILTENIRTPMYLIDKWTPLMAGILAVSIVVWRLTAGGKKLDRALAWNIISSGVKK